MENFKTIILLTAAVLVAAVSCSKDGNEPEGRMAVLSYEVNLSEVTKAIGDGTMVDKMVYAIFDENGTQVKKEVVEKVGSQFSFSPSLYYGKTYRIVLFAYKDGAYTVDNITEIARNKDGEEADAFALTETVKITQDGKLQINGGEPVAATTRSVELTRSVAQLAVATEVFADMAEAGAAKIQVVLNAPGTYNAMTGAVGPAADATYTTAVADLGSISVSGKAYTVVSCSYLYPADTQEVTINILKEDDTVLRKIILTNVPLRSNQKTNIYGNLVKGELTFDVSMNVVFDKNEDNKDNEVAIP